MTGSTASCMLLTIDKQEVAMTVKTKPYQLIPRRVDGLHKQCSLYMLHGGRCGIGAVWAVQNEHGDFLWRCEAHKSVVDVRRDGSYTEGNWTDTVLVSLPHWRH